ncbi:hypothetical protein DENSPDRAFT_871157 [Dentipellis sp. KUC8613]|nr:hypothetical protein DENSPDRAFT_871157 [Dentipellis sp. KUC8613]
MRSRIRGYNDPLESTSLIARKGGKKCERVATCRYQASIAPTAMGRGGAEKTFEAGVGMGALIVISIKAAAIERWVEEHDEDGAAKEKFGIGLGGELEIAGGILRQRAIAPSPAPLTTPCNQTTAPTHPIDDRQPSYLRFARACNAVGLGDEGVEAVRPNEDEQAEDST